MYKAVIFDIDGTLTAPVHENAWFELTQGLGASIEKHQNLYKAVIQKELSLGEAKYELLKVWSVNGEVAKQKAEQIFEHVPLREGAEDVVRYLQSKNYKLCLITGSPSTYAEVIGRRLSVKDFYANQFYWNDAHVLVDYEYDPKQDEKKLRQFNQFIEVNKLHPQECVVVGDGWNDNKLFTFTGNGIVIHPVDGSEIDNRLKSLSVKTISSLYELKTLL